MAVGSSSDEASDEASDAFVHLMKWLLPNGSLLLPWLRCLYTHHACIMRWTFSISEIARLLGSATVSLRSYSFRSLFPSVCLSLRFFSSLFL